MRAILLAAAIPLALPVLFLAACGKPADKVTVTTEGGRTQVQTGPAGAQVTVTDDAGQTTVIKAGASAAAAVGSIGAPAFAPVYPGAAILSRIDTGQGGGATILKFTTRDTPDQVMAFYRDAATKGGLPVSADMDMGGSKMFAAEEEGGARGMQLTAAASKEGFTVVQLTYHVAKG